MREHRMAFKSATVPLDYRIFRYSPSQGVSLLFSVFCCVVFFKNVLYIYMLRFYRIAELSGF